MPGLPRSTLLQASKPPPLFVCVCVCVCVRVFVCAFVGVLCGWNKLVGAAAPPVLLAPNHL